MNVIKLGDKTITPSKVVCVGRNYVEHIKELANELPEQMVIFLKPNSAISSKLAIGNDEPIHYEAELAFVIAEGALAAVGFGLDLTKRELQTKLKQKGLPWERSKAFDGSAVLSDFVAIDGGLADLGLELLIDGQLVQQGGVGQMINQPKTMLADIGHFMTMEDGDVLLTGTPKGVGVIKRGSEFRGRVLCRDKVLLEVTWVVE